MSNMLEDERFDGMLLNFAQQCQGIEPLLDTLFSFMRRKTDFFRSGDDEKAKNMVLKMLEKHQSLADKTNEASARMDETLTVTPSHRRPTGTYASWWPWSLMRKKLCLRAKA